MVDVYTVSFVLHNVFNQVVVLFIGFFHDHSYRQKKPRITTISIETRMQTLKKFTAVVFKYC